MKVGIWIIGSILLIATLSLLNGLLILPPVQAGSCTANCGPNSQPCKCTGTQCSATDGKGCSGGDGVIPSVSCSCGNS